MLLKIKYNKTPFYAHDKKRGTSVQNTATEHVKHVHMNVESEVDKKYKKTIDLLNFNLISTDELNSCLFYFISRFCLYTYNLNIYIVASLRYNKITISCRYV